MADRAASVAVGRRRIAEYAARLPPGPPASDSDHGSGSAAFWITLDAINFGSGWFPTLRKRDGLSGYNTIAAGLGEFFSEGGGWTAEALADVDATLVARVLGQDPEHELMGLFGRSLRDLGHHVSEECGGRFEELAAGDSAAVLAARLGTWDCFADCSVYDGIDVPFLKRAQIAAADLQRSGAARFSDLDRLTMFADNLVPHVLRLDGILTFEPDLVARIEREELIEHGSPEEVEIRACALHAVELIVAARGGATTAAEVDQVLWLRGGEPRYKSVPRHRSRCTAY